jgi:NAD(P)-dependent dehydrogenase (short-subunit alcohol dehydrogenase family)
MDLQLTDKVAIVTGSSKGLGLAAARALLAEGASVAICARGRETLKTAVESLRDLSGRAGAVQDVEADVSTPAGCETVVKETLARFGRIDILVNNVGKAGGGDIVSTSDD